MTGILAAKQRDVVTMGLRPLRLRFEIVSRKLGNDICAFLPSVRMDLWVVMKDVCGFGRLGIFKRQGLDATHWISCYDALTGAILKLPPGQIHC